MLELWQYFCGVLIIVWDIYSSHTWFVCFNSPYLALYQLFLWNLAALFAHFLLPNYVWVLWKWHVFPYQWSNTEWYSKIYFGYTKSQCSKMSTEHNCWLTLWNSWKTVLKLTFDDFLLYLYQFFYDVLIYVYECAPRLSSVYMGYSVCKCRYMLVDLLYVVTGYAFLWH